MAERRVRAVIHGNVQGVFFREYTRRQASQLGLRGWVRNRADGTVETVFAGDAQAVGRMQSWLWLGSPTAKVRQVDSSDMSSADDLPPGFEIRP